jgi:hypothetical protein
VGADRDQRYRAGEAGLVEDVRHEFADAVAGLHQRSEQAGCDADPLYQAPRPVAAPNVEQPGGGGVGHLGDHRRGEPVAQQVRYPQQVPGLGQLRRAGRCHQLVDRGERRLLQAGGLVGGVSPARDVAAAEQDDLAPRGELL